MYICAEIEKYSNVLLLQEYKNSCIVGDNSHQSVECTNSLDVIDEAHTIIKSIFLFQA
jgi:hypothetical protein